MASTNRDRSGSTARISRRSSSSMITTAFIFRLSRQDFGRMILPCASTGRISTFDIITNNYIYHHMINISPLFPFIGVRHHRNLPIPPLTRGGWPVHFLEEDPFAFPATCLSRSGDAPSLWLTMYPGPCDLPDPLRWTNRYTDTGVSIREWWHQGPEMRSWSDQPVCRCT